MKYFTKEWYIDSLVAEMCFQLRKTEKASVYSDKFFEKLYALEKKAYSRYKKRIAKATHAKFDLSAASAEFDNNYQDNLEFIKANLPDDILSDVKDLRVLALGSATHDIAMRITRYCGKKNRLCEATERKYNNDSEEADEKAGAAVSRALIMLPGAMLASCDPSPEYEPTLSFIPNDGTENITLIFKKGELTETCGEISSMTVIKHELLLCDDSRFEFSLLLSGPDSSLHTITYLADKIEIQ